MTDDACHFGLSLDWHSWLIKWVPFAMRFALVSRFGLTLWLVVLATLAFIKELMCWLSRLVVSNKQQKPRLKQTTYRVHAPSSIERLSLEQTISESYQNRVPSLVLCLSRPDCISFTSIEFEADGSLCILWQMMHVTSVWVWTGSQLVN